nr:PREDICTED: uncharacterized protein LOC107077158 isoform X2 [Lepisosteus oculatus]
MEILILKGLVSIFLLDLCNSQVTVLEPYSSSEISMTTQVGTAVPDREIETTQESDNNEQDEDGNRDILDTTTYDTRNEVVALGLEAWRFGAISAAVLLVLETIVVIVYCLKCKKRRIRRTMAVKMIEDSEAAETIHGESNENTLTGGDVQPNQTASNGSCEVTIPKEKQEIKADILLDSLSRDASL